MALSRPNAGSADQLTQPDLRAIIGAGCARIGWERALDPPPGGWAAGEPPPGPGNAVEILIDGAQALPAIAEELQRARSHVHIDRLVLLTRLRARTRRRARSCCAISSPSSPSGSTCACWSGPGRRCRSFARRDATCGRCAISSPTAHEIQCGLDAQERPLHCHHEKTIVIDDRVAFVGGIDLTVGVRRPLRHERPSSARNGRLARRLRADRGPGGRRRRRALPDALARSHRRDSSPPVTPAEPRRRRSSCRSSAPCRSTSTTPCRDGDFRILESYVRAMRGRRAIHLPREPVPLVAGDRGRARATSCSTRRAPTSGSCSSSRQSRTAAPTTPAAFSAS